MAARCSKVLARCASAILSLAGLQACVDDGVSLHVICPIFPDIEEGSCVFDPAGEACVLEGVLNLAIAQTYKQSLRVESGLFARTRSVPPQGEPNGIQIRSAHVDIRVPSGARLPVGQLPNPFDVVAVGYSPPGAQAAVTVTMLPSEYIAELRQPHYQDFPQLVLRVTLKGKTNGDENVTAGEYAWPVRVINETDCSPVSHCVSLTGQDAFATACP